jgi:hypothetical protein
MQLVEQEPLWGASDTALRLLGNAGSIYKRNSVVTGVCTLRSALHKS